MQQIFRGLAVLTLFGAVASLGACTVHHHHGEDGQAVAGQPTPAYQHQGAPGQSYAPAPRAPHATPAPGTPIYPGYGPDSLDRDGYSRNYNRDYNSNYDRDYQPTDPYAAPRASARDHHDHRCECEKRARKRKPAVAPNTYAPAGPVTPSELRSSDPADWLE